MCSIDLEPCTIWNEAHHKARKPYKCRCCGSPIEPGEMYMAHFSVFEGDATHEKMCLPCEADRKEFFDAHDGMSCTPSYLRQMIQECISENDDDDRERWVPLLNRIRARGTANASKS